MTDIASLIARARLIKNETESEANTAQRVGSLLEDMINTFSEDKVKAVTDVTLLGQSVVDDGVADIKYPTRTYKTKYGAPNQLHRVFSLSYGGSVVIRYTYSVNGRTWEDELHYTNTSYPTTGYFFSSFHSDFVESRKSTSAGYVCLRVNKSQLSPTATVKITVIALDGEITWYDDFIAISQYDIPCEMVSSVQSTADASELHTSVNGTIYDDSGNVVSRLENNTLYSMNASDSSGRFTIPSRTDYEHTHIYCLGDGTVFFNGEHYEYKSGNTIVLDGETISIANEVKDYYTKEETDSELGKKVDKADGYSLMSDTEHAKLGGIEALAQKNVQSDWNATSGDAFIKNKPTSLPASGGNADTVDNTHASDFALKTEIPTKTSQLSNDSGYVTDAQVESKLETYLMKKDIIPYEEIMAL